MQHTDMLRKKRIQLKEEEKDFPIRKKENK
jgi:hypothetical protein